jgi:hypothetical protein
MDAYRGCFKWHFIGGLRPKTLLTMQAADGRAQTLRPVFDELRELSANAIARELNARQIGTPSGKPWRGRR